MSDQTDFDWKAELEALRRSGKLLNYEHFLLELEETDYRLAAGELSEAEHQRAVQGLWLGSPNPLGNPNREAMQRIIDTMRREAAELKRRKATGSSTN